MSSHRKLACLSFRVVASLALGSSCGDESSAEVPVRPAQPPAAGDSSARSWDVCPLFGPDAPQPGVYGTDLGITAPLPAADGSAARLAMLFGDTYAERGSECTYPVVRHDDLQATLPATRPAELGPNAPDATSAAACGTVRYAREAGPFRAIRLFPDASERDPARALDTSLLRTPAAAFSDGRTLFAIFIRHDPATCSDNTMCPSGMVCSSDPTYSGPQLGGCQPHVGVTEDAAPVLCRPEVGCAPPAVCAALPEGRCLAAQPFPTASPVATSWYAEDPRRAVAQQMYIASAFWPDRPEDYATGFKFTTNKFAFVSARTVAYFDPERPEDNDYRPGNHTLLLWGRPHVIGERGYQSLPFLLAQPLQGLLEPNGAIRWAPQFFAGYGADGRPVWSNSEADAHPVYGADTLESAPEFDYVVHSSFTYLEPVQRWVLAYGGSVPAWMAADAATGELLEPFHAQPEPGAIYLRSAAHPWGRLTRDAPASQAWTGPRVLLRRVSIKDRLACDDDTPEAPDCTIPADANRPGNLAAVLAGFSSPPTPEEGASVIAMCTAGAVALDTQYSVADDSGAHLYGTNIIQSWTEDVTSHVGALGRGERAIEMYWNVSTWNPYQVLLMKSQVRATPSDVY